jgi:hypothetical protein
MTLTCRLTMVTSCTGDKATDSPRRLQLQDFLDGDRLKNRELELTAHSRPAAAMYTGQQHIHLRVGVRALRDRFGRDAVSLWIVSAGYGVVSEDRVIAPYNVTFNAMGRRPAVEWARRLDIPGSIRTAVADSPLVVFLLGEEYLRAVQPAVVLPTGGRVVFVAKPALRHQLEALGATVVPVGREDARRYGSGYVALKGRMFELFAKGLAKEGMGLWRDVCDDPTPRSFRTAVEIGNGGDN